MFKIIFLLVVLGLAFLIILILFIDLVLTILTMTFYNGPFYAPVSDKRIAKILRLINVKKDQKIVDLGSGNGKVLIALAKKGFNVLGLEINPWLVFKSRKRIKKAGFGGKTEIKWADFWKVNLGEFNVIIIYGIGYMMKRLEQKLLKEVKKDLQVITVSFPFPNLNYEKKLEDVYCYKLKAKS
jgi:tRNA G46 methylase TrmB